MSSLRLGRQGRSRGVLLLLRVLQVAQPFGLAWYCSVPTFQSYGLGSQDLAKTRFVADALERSQAVVKRLPVSHGSCESSSFHFLEPPDPEHPRGLGGGWEGVVTGRCS